MSQKDRVIVYSTDRYRIEIPKQPKSRKSKDPSDVYVLCCYACETQAFSMHQNSFARRGASTITALTKQLGFVEATRIAVERWFNLPFDVRLEWIAKAIDKLKADGISEAAVWEPDWNHGLRIRLEKALE